MLKEIYLGGGCFWGTQKYFALIKGVTQTQVGYANGNTQNPTYEDVCRRNTGHVEAVKLVYEDSVVSLSFILEMYYDVIDPTSLNKQGGDMGVQYRTGIYYIDESDYDIIAKSIENLQEKYNDKIAIEVKPLENYFLAEEYHQDYLEKNPGGYCHIGKKEFKKAENAVDNNTKFAYKSKEELRRSLSEMQYKVTQENSTEPPFKNEYYNSFAEGIYVDITTGEPLFASCHKFESGCGWPAFSKPINKNLVNEIGDSSHGMMRIEARSKKGDAHLGHVFTDGPAEMGGLRYCINSASLKFVAKAQMEEQGYGEYLDMV